MHLRLTRAILAASLVLLTSTACLAAPAGSAPAKAAPGIAGVIEKDEVIAGGPKDSLEVRHLVLRGTNEQIGRALAEIARERYGAKLDKARDPIQVRAQRKFLERNDPILLERMRGVAAAYGKDLEDDAWDFSALGFTDLKAGCSVAHLPPQFTKNGKSVVSRDYDYSTGNLFFGFLEPGQLHPTARPYLVELHPDRGYASLAMVAYDFLSGALDGINSEGLTVTMAMDDEVRTGSTMEPTRDPAVGLGELQTVRLLLDTCATVEEAKETLQATKQYYQYVPVHYLIADRTGKAFIWEYSEARNKESMLESPGEPLVMTNFNLGKRLENGKPPSADAVTAVCPRYAFLKEKLATGTFDDKEIRDIHQQVDGQRAQAPDATRPSIRTFWHAFYYPEDRRVRLSYYLGEEPIPGSPLVKQIRSDYLEFKLEPTGETGNTGNTGKGRPPTAVPAMAEAAPNATPADGGSARAAIEAAGGKVTRDGRRMNVSLAKVSNLEAVLPLLQQLPDLDELNLGNPAMTDTQMVAIQGHPKLRSLGLMGAPIGDAALATLKTLPSLRILNIMETKVTDAGLAHLSGLTALEYLCLKDTAISDVGLAQLKNLTNLTNFILADTKVTDAGLVHLAGMTRLESINLSNTLITDAGLAHLGRIPGLAGVNVMGTKVTDAGLIHLKPLPKLTKLNVKDTAVTEAGVKQAKAFLPFWATITR
jgi:hypothetical protein